MRWLAHISFALLLAASAGYAVPSATTASGNPSITVRWSPDAVQAQRQLEPSESVKARPSATTRSTAVRPQATPTTPEEHPLFQRPPPASTFSL